MFDELSDITLIETPLMDSAGFPGIVVAILLQFTGGILHYSSVLLPQEQTA